MIICKRPKTPYNANKWILGVFAKWEYERCLLHAYISREFVFLWCTPMYIECFQCVIDKCYHYWLISKIFDMVSAGGGRTTVLYAIKFHATVFHLNICSYVHTSVIWIYAHMNIRSFEKHMNNCSCIHLWQKCMLEHMNNHSYMQMVVYNLIVRSCRIYRIENISQLTSYT